MSEEPRSHLYTIYRHMPEYPGKLVVVRFLITDKGIIPDKIAWTVCDTIYQARQSIPPGLTLFPRAHDDAECVVESWI